MKILQMCRNLGTGGIEAMVCSLSNELAKEHDVTVCTIARPSSEDKFYKELSPSIHRETIRPIGKGKPIREMVKIARFIAKGQFDIIQIHGFFYYYALAVFLYHRKFIFCYTIHSDASKENNPWDVRILFFKKFCFKYNWLHPITISEMSRASFYNLYDCKSHLIPNGVICPEPNADNTLNAYKHSIRTKVFLHASRICPEKNQIMLCRVFLKLIQENEDIVLIIAGPIHHREIYDQMYPYFSERIVYIQDRADIPELLCSADGMCLCSFYEGLPMILLESLAAGCIPVCTAVGGVVNVIEEGITGFLASEVTDEAFYQAMKRMLKLNDAERQVMKMNCIAKSKQYTIEQCARQYINYYNSLLNTTNFQTYSM